MKDHPRMRGNQTAMLAALVALVLTLTTFDISLAAEPKKPEAGAGPAAWVGDLAPIGPSDWNYARAGHLLERAGFGGTPEEIERLAKMTPEEAVNCLVDYDALDNKHLPPFEESGIFPKGIDPILTGCPIATAIRSGYATNQANGITVKKVEGTTWLQPIVQEGYYHIWANRAEVGRVEHWWAERMLNTNRPLEEKMTLFWHGHFATSSTKVRDYRMILKQRDMLSKNATGNFRTLLIGIAQDPAMLIYLDNGLNVKGAANENFAREVMELFSMGVGNYSEQDIREAARAFTGWTNRSVEFVIDADKHDTGKKTVLGETGNFDGTDVIDIILRQKATARYIARKLHRFFVRDKMAPELEAKLADDLRAGKYELKPFLKKMFLSKDFYSPESYASQIKSPVQLTISTYRKLGLKEIPGMPDFRTVTRDLGQELSYPPNVAGWEGGAAWINPATLLARGNFARELLFPDARGFTVPPDQVTPPAKLAPVKKDDNKDPKKEEPKSAATTLLKSVDYSLRDAVIWAIVKSNQTVKPIPRPKLQLDLREMVKASGAKTSDEAVDYLIRRLLRAPLESDDRQQLVAFLTKQAGGDKLDYENADLEKTLRALVHLIMSTPEYQLA